MVKTRKIRIEDKELHTMQFSVSSDLSRPSLVFLHDALGCTTSWKSFPKNLCQALQMNGLVFDRLGHGLSSPSTTTRSVDYLEKEALEILPQVLQKMGIRTPILIGSSDGGSIALVYAGKYPVKALVSLAGHSKVESITLEGIREGVKVLKKAPLFQKLEKLHGRKSQKLLNDWADTWLSPAYRHWNIERFLEGIDCPALILQGKEDQYATDQHAIGIAKRISGPSAYQIMQGCGHFPHLDKAEETIALIKTFFEHQDVC